MPLITQLLCPLLHVILAVPVLVHVVPVITSLLSSRPRVDDAGNVSDDNSEFDDAGIDAPICVCVCVCDEIREREKKRE